jgi:hypothetical protein
MSDVVLVAVIVVFFVAAALLVRAFDKMISRAGEAGTDAAQEPEPDGRP